MNNARRKELDKIKYELDKIKENISEHSLDDLESLKDALSDVLLDEEFAYDNMPENLKNSMRGQESEEAIEYIDEAFSTLDSIKELNDDSIEEIEEAIEELDNII